MASAEKWLKSWSENSRVNFENNHRIKAFGEYLADLETSPYSLTRNAVQYVVDMMEFFGEEKAYSMGELLTRFKLFALSLPQSAIPPVAGNEEAIMDIYSALKNFVIEGKVDRMIHLHGPSGSGKSLIVEWLMRGLEEYSRKKEGALYTFHWIFPTEGGKRMGFGENTSKEGTLQTFAYLPAGEISFRIACDMNESPLLLISPKRRLAFLEELLKKADEKEKEKFSSTKYILEADLCPRCRAIFDALHDEYGGDVEKVLRHVQVKRFHVSRKYHRGAAVISPQETPDAEGRLLSTDSSLENIPSALQHLTMEQVTGNLVNASNGILEYSDFLARPTNFNKYLLSATDSGSIEVSKSLLSLNLVPFATSNEESLDAFKESPEFPPFKGITMFIPVSYLLERSKEGVIYFDTLKKISKFKHIAPYLAEEAALWAILTRLHRPQPENYPKEFKETIEKLTTYQKASMYDSFNLVVPELCDISLDKIELLSYLKEEFKGTQFYEGRFGVSPREMAESFYDQAYNKENNCIGVFDLLERLNLQIKDRSLFKFLQLKPEKGYHDPFVFQQIVRKEYLKLFENDLLQVLQIYPKGGVLEMVETYFKSILDNKTSGESEKHEKLLAGEKNPASYRDEIAKEVEAGLKRSEWGFMPRFFQEAGNYEARLKKGKGPVIKEAIQNSLDILAGGERNLEAENVKKTQKIVETLMEDFSYCPHCLYENLKAFMDDKNLK